MILKIQSFIKYYYHLLQNKSFLKNLNEVERLLFIHNPKVAGNSLLKVLNIKLEAGESTSHLTLTYLVSKKVWESYFSVLAVRHPLERLISSFNYHTKASYQGHFLRKYSDLHNFTFEQYFKVFSKEPYAIIPQVEYTKHLLSKKKVDFIIRYENLQEDVDKLCGILKIEKHQLPHLNQSPKKEMNYFRDESFKQEVLKYHQEDFEYFNYSEEF
jgi:hypothetical protein